MGTEQVKSTQAGKTFQLGCIPKWATYFQKEKEEIVIPFAPKGNVTTPVKSEDKQFKNFYGLNIDPSMIKNIEVQNYNDKKLVNIDLYEGDASIMFFDNSKTPNSKVYKDENGYTVFENTKGINYNSYDNSDKIVLINTKDMYLYTGMGSDTIKIDNSKYDYIANYGEGESSIVLMDASVDPTKAPSAKGLTLNATNVENNLFWTENLKQK